MLSAVAAASATVRLPEFGQCVKDARGQYTDAGCTERVGEHRGGFEWLGRGKIASREITATAPEVVIEGVDGHKIVCAGTGGGGGGGVRAGEMGLTVEPPGLNETRGFLVLNGCVDVSSGASCGEIKTKELGAKLGYISGGGSPHPVVGLDMKPVKGRVFAEFACPASGPKNVVLGKKKGSSRGGSLISHIEPIDEMTTSFAETYAQTGGVQNPTSFESGEEDTLEASFTGPNGPFEQVGMQLTYTNTNEEPLEIRAYCSGC
jgi:hypothetical protein